MYEGLELITAQFRVLKINFVISQALKKEMLFHGTVKAWIFTANSGKRVCGPNTKWKSETLLGLFPVQRQSQLGLGSPSAEGCVAIFWNGNMRYKTSREYRSKMVV